MESVKLVTLLSYALCALLATVFLGRNLYRNGEVFIANLFESRPELVKPINNILLIGFYLVNTAFVLLYLSKDNVEIHSYGQGISFLCSKLGFVFTILGIWHYFNIAILLSTKFIQKKYISWKTSM